MKKISTLLVALFVSTILLAQVPQAFNYQAVARNNAGAALANQTIKVRLSVLRGATSLYSETRSVTTNLLGLFNVQIGSTGATATTGNFTNINWLINTPDITKLKVELDIANTNVFTDMGTQAFSTVPYAFSAATAIDAINLGGRYVDPVPVPATGDVLQWNGTAWTPYTLPAAPTVGSWQGPIATIPFGGQNAPWVFAGPTVTITVDGTQKILATATAVFENPSSSPQNCSFSMCWSAVPAGSVLNSFQGGQYLEAVVGGSGNATNLSATGLITLPAGTYKFGFGIRNKSTSINFNFNQIVNGTYQIIK